MSSSVRLPGRERLLPRRMRRMAYSKASASHKAQPMHLSPLLVGCSVNVGAEGCSCTNTGHALEEVGDSAGGGKVARCCTDALISCDPSVEKWQLPHGDHGYLGGLGAAGPSVDGQGGKHGVRHPPSPLQDPCRYSLLRGCPVPHFSACMCLQLHSCCCCPVPLKAARCLGCRACIQDPAQSAVLTEAA